MITGAFILIAGMVIGYAIAFFIPKKKENKYERYRDENGLLSRKAVKEFGQGRK